MRIVPQSCQYHTFLKRYKVITPIIQHYKNELSFYNPSTLNTKHIEWKILRCWINVHETTIQQNSEIQNLIQRTYDKHWIFNVNQCSVKYTQNSLTANKITTNTYVRYPRFIHNIVILLRIFVVLLFSGSW
jgi:hypothetical protein